MAKQNPAAKTPLKVQELAAGDRLPVADISGASDDAKFAAATLLTAAFRLALLGGTWRELSAPAYDQLNVTGTPAAAKRFRRVAAAGTITEIVFTGSTGAESLELYDDIEPGCLVEIRKGTAGHEAASRGELIAYFHVTAASYAGDAAADSWLVITLAGLLLDRRGQWSRTSPDTWSTGTTAQAVRLRVLAPALANEVGPVDWDADADKRDLAIGNRPDQLVKERGVTLALLAKGTALRFLGWNASGIPAERTIERLDIFAANRMLLAAQGADDDVLAVLPPAAIPRTWQVGAFAPEPQQTVNSLLTAYLVWDPSVIALSGFAEAHYALYAGAAKVTNATTNLGTRVSISNLDLSTIDTLYARRNATASNLKERTVNGWTDALAATGTAIAFRMRNHWLFAAVTAVDESPAGTPANTVKLTLDVRRSSATAATDLTDSTSSGGALWAAREVDPTPTRTLLISLGSRGGANLDDAVDRHLDYVDGAAAPRHKWSDFDEIRAWGFDASGDDDGISAASFDTALLPADAASYPVGDRIHVGASAESPGGVPLLVLRGESTLRLYAEAHNQLRIWGYDWS